MHGIYRQSNLPYFTKKLCPKCEQPINKNNLVCPYCSYSFIVPTKKVNNAPTPQVSKPVVNTVESTPVIIEKPVSKQEQVIFCESCGTKLPIGTKYCSNCGSKITKSFCSFCGGAVDEKQIFCPHCGKKLKSGIENYNSVEVPASIEHEDNNDTSSEVKESETLEATTIIEANKVTPEEEATVTLESGEGTFETTQVENNQEENDEFANINLKEFVNMGRKRFFIVFELIVSLFILLVAMVVPIMNKGSFTSNFISLMSEPFSELDKTLVETGKLTNGIYLIRYLIGEFSASNYLIAIVSLPSEMLAIDGLYICSYLSISEAVINFIVVGFYLALLVVFVLNLICSLVHLGYKGPYKAKMFGVYVIVLFIGSIFLYTQKFIPEMVAYDKGYDSWVIYGFGVAFLIWFIMKLVFSNEVKMYKRIKEYKQNKQQN